LSLPSDISLVRTSTAYHNDIHSMATSSAEEAPRGMEFLYNLNRLNVATSQRDA